MARNKFDCRFGSIVLKLPLNLTLNHILNPKCLLNCPPVLRCGWCLDDGEGEDDEDDDGDEPRHHQRLDVHLQPAVVLPCSAKEGRKSLKDHILCNFGLWVFIPSWHLYSWFNGSARLIPQAHGGKGAWPKCDRNYETVGHAQLALTIRYQLTIWNTILFRWH